MKRYFCEKCQRIVRCRRLPTDAVPNPDPKKIRCGMLGTCWHHDSNLTRAQVNARVRGGRVGK